MMERPQNQEELAERRLQLQSKYNQIEKDRFELAMKDIWDDSDYRQEHEWHEEMLKIKKELEKLYEQNWCWKH